MAAKKDVIKKLRQEILDLNAVIKEQACEIGHRKKMFASEHNRHNMALAVINTQTNNIAAGLKHRFLKELTWLALCDDPDSKIQIVKRTIDDLHSIARPRKNA